MIIIIFATNYSYCTFFLEPAADMRRELPFENPFPSRWKAEAPDASKIRVSIMIASVAGVVQPLFLEIARF
jgi:hypothetical protein